MSRPRRRSSRVVLADDVPDLQVGGSGGRLAGIPDVGPGRPDAGIPVEQIPQPRLGSVAVLDPGGRDPSTAAVENPASEQDTPSPLHSRGVNDPGESSRAADWSGCCETPGRQLPEEKGYKHFADPYVPRIAAEVLRTKMHGLILRS